LRRELRDRRPNLCAGAWTPSSAAPQPTQCFGATQETLTRLALTDGDLVEIGTADGAPVRGRICRAERLAANVVGLETATLTMLELEPGDPLWLRPVTQSSDL
jgi:hypothetical protein